MNILMKPEETNTFSNLKSSNKAYYNCVGESYAMGLGSSTKKCTNNECAIYNNYKLPPHYKIGLNFIFMYGDSCKKNLYLNKFRIKIYILKKREWRII